jgi:hypothetical protein
MDADTPSDAFLSWQGDVTGPHSIEEIRGMLKRGKIHSLYKIKVGKEWVLLRDRLAEIDRMNRARPAVATVKVSSSGWLAESSPISAQAPPPLGHGFLSPGSSSDQSDTRKLEFLPPEEDADMGHDPADGLAMASFVLSLCFFIPILNGITQLLALIFAHLALAQMGPRYQGRSRSLASAALWITYVQIGFLASSMIWMAVTKVPNLSLGYFVNHFHMVAIALTALVGSGLLMLAVRLFSGYLPTFRNCFIGALLPSAVNTLGGVIIRSKMLEYSPTAGEMFAALGLFQTVMFVFQMIFWSRLICLPDGSELGMGRAALASLFYSVVFLFIAILYGMLFVALSPL